MEINEFLKAIETPVDSDGDFELYVRDVNPRRLMAGDNCAVYRKSDGECLGQCVTVSTYIYGPDGKILEEPIRTITLYEIRRTDE